MMALTGRRANTSAAASTSSPKWSSISARTGGAPTRTIASQAAPKGNGTVRTASPGPMASACRATSSASVPLATPTTCSTPRKSANSCSKPRTSSPPMNAVRSMTPATAASMSLRRLRYSAARSRRGTRMLARLRRCRGKRRRAEVGRGGGAEVFHSIPDPLPHLRTSAPPHASQNSLHRRVIQHHHGVRQRGPVAADDVHGDLLGHLRALGLGFDAHQAGARVHLGAGGYRADEAQLVGAVVRRVAVADDAIVGAGAAHRPPTERQKAVRDRGLERTLALRALDVDVNPLVVAGELGELVDHLLRHRDLGSPWTELVADVLAQTFDVVEANLLHTTSLPDVVMPSARSVHSI